MLAVQGSNVSKYFAMEPLFLSISSISTTVIIDKSNSFQKSFFNQAK